MRLFALCLGFVFVFAPMAARADIECSVKGAWPPSLTLANSTSDVPIQADVFGKDQALIGRQVMFHRNGETTVPVISRELLSRSENPTPRCSIAQGIHLTQTTVVDVGPQIIVNTLYQSASGTTVSFYAYQEDYFKGRKDEGLVNQLFVVQLDDRAGTQIQVTAQPGQDVTVRFDHVSAGSHRIRFAELEPFGSGFAPTLLWNLGFTQPQFK